MKTKAAIFASCILMICSNNTFRPSVRGTEKQPPHPEKGKKMSDKEITEMMLTRMGEPGGKVLVTPEDVKNIFPDKSKWMEHKRGEHKYLFCIINLTIVTAYKEEVRGWAYRESSKQWAPIFTARLQDTAGVDISVDPKTGIFTAKEGATNSGYKNRSVFSFDLEFGK